jgi:hypothetical protein
VTAKLHANFKNHSMREGPFNHAAKGLLRHSNVNTTERHYIKDVSENTIATMKKLEMLCGGRAIARPNELSGHSSMSC